MATKYLYLNSSILLQYDSITTSGTKKRDTLIQEHDGLTIRVFETKSVFTIEGAACKPVSSKLLSKLVS